MLSRLSDEQKKEMSRNFQLNVIFLCVLISFVLLLVSQKSPAIWRRSSNIHSDFLPSTNHSQRLPSSNAMVILINVHISAKDGSPFKGSKMQCLGIYTFILTRSSHKMDLVFFHNHNNTLYCDGIDSWEGTGVRFVQITLKWFEDRVANLGIDANQFWPEGPHEAIVCDFKPLYGHIFSTHIQDYPFWAYGDVDGVFGYTELFNPSLWQYDLISGYCNTNADWKPPSDENWQKMRCTKGWAAGPLMIIKNNDITRRVMEYSLKSFWIDLFKIPVKKQLDEQFGSWPNLHVILQNESIPLLHWKTLPFHDLKQYCTNACEENKRTRDLFVFNLIPKAANVIPLKFRWTRSDGTWLSFDGDNGEERYRIHFLHWSHWKYYPKARMKQLVGMLYWHILHNGVDCFEMFTIPPRVELCDPMWPKFRLKLSS